MSKLYLCDPTLNTSCKKTLCQKECKITHKKEYAKVLIDPMDGMKMIVYSDMGKDVGLEEVQK